MKHLTLTLPDGTHFDIPHTPGVSFLIGKNGTGKSIAAREAAAEHAEHVLYVATNREATRALLSRRVRELASSLLVTLGFAEADSKDSSGLLNVSCLGAGIYDDARAFVILDEPEQSLHPQAQHLLLQVLREVAHKQHKHFLLITHSPSMIGLSEAAVLSRMYFVRRPDDHAPRREVFRIPPAEALEYEEALTDLNTYKREAFFADNVILVEGHTDRDLLLKLIEVGGFGPALGKTSVIPLGGFGDLAKYASLFKSIGVRPVAVCDLDVIFPTSGQHWHAATGDDAWRGWCTPGDVAAAARGRAPGAPTRNPERFEELERLGKAARGAIEHAERLVVHAEELPASLQPAREQLDAPRPRRNPTLKLLVQAALYHDDWHGTGLEKALRAVADTVLRFQARALELDIVLFENGAIEDQYRHGGVGIADKSEASRREIVTIGKIYGHDPAGALRDYPRIFGPLTALGIL